MITDLLKSLSSSFAVGRKVRKVNDVVIKIYSNPMECIYEYSVLRKIAESNPITFFVPKVYKIIVNSYQALLIMERLEGIPLTRFVTPLYSESEAIKVFHGLGEALRELHFLDIGELRNLSIPSSTSEMISEIIKLSQKLTLSNLLDCKIKETILKVTRETNKVKNEIFTTVNLHGEFYYTHVFLSKGKYAFFDFHEASKGPCYFDLAKFTGSLYVSLYLSLQIQDMKKLEILSDAFFSGYFGKNYDDNLIRSIKLAELYMYLKGMWNLRSIYQESSPLATFIIMQKIRKLKKAIEKVILPNLIQV
ncbi:MAG: phosphotransferase [Thermofilaceae archaeon]